MRVISWNMNKRKEGCWEFAINNLSSDFVMAQEASPLIKGISATERITTKKTNRTVFYSRDKNYQEIKMEDDNGMGLLVTCYKNIYFINVYANLDFKPVNPPLLGFISKFVSNLRRRHDAKNIIIAGDFNMDRRMDDNPTKSVFAKKGTYPTNDFFNAILDMGFYDCVRKQKSKPVQTFRHNKGNFPWELDHMFCTKELYDCLKRISVQNTKELSDHNPIIADFDL
jgi:exonuclease III